MIKALKIQPLKSQKLELKKKLFKLLQVQYNFTNIF